MLTLAIASHLGSLLAAVGAIAYTQKSQPLGWDGFTADFTRSGLGYHGSQYSSRVYKKSSRPLAFVAPRGYNGNTTKARCKMSGIVVFRSVPEALRAGFQVYDRASFGYLVRTRTAAGWALAEVHCK